MNDVLKKLARINDVKGLPSRFEVRTARTMAATQTENEMKMKIENQRLIDEELEKEKEKKVEKLKKKDRNSQILNFKTPLKIEKTVFIAPNVNVTTVIEDPVPDFVKKTLCGHLKCLVSRVKVLFSLTEGTALHALTLLLR